MRHGMRDSVKGSLRCTPCLTRWPNQPSLFQPCPECNQATFFSVLDPIDRGEANARYFEAFYARREVERGTERAAKQAEVGAQIDELHIDVEFDETLLGDTWD